MFPDPTTVLRTCPAIAAGESTLKLPAHPVSVAMGRDFVAQVLTGLADDAVRLYEEGSTIRQVAEKFGTGYGAMRRILRQHTTLRNRGGRRP